jgi:hypothetical protein
MLSLKLKYENIGEILDIAFLWISISRAHILPILGTLVNDLAALEI